MEMEMEKEMENEKKTLLLLRWPLAVNCGRRCRCRET